MNWTINAQAKVNAELAENGARFCFQENTEETYVELTYALPYEADGEEYVLLPSCCYDGNRFDVLKKDYPPLYGIDEAGVDMPVTITDVPRLNKDGSGSIQITTGDVSVPCVGVFSKKEKKAIFIFTIQQIDGVNLGLSYEKGKVGITYPHMRKDEMYIWPHMRKSIDKGMKFAENQTIEIPFKVLEFPCEAMDEFYHLFFLNRKCMGMNDRLKKPLRREKQFEIQRDKMNKYNWKEAGQFYGVETEPNGLAAWQPGWIGGGMYTYPLMKLGGELEWERGMKTLHHVFKGQTEAGFLYDSGDEQGNFNKVLFGYDHSEGWTLVRKTADVFYYMFMHLNLIKERGREVPAEFEAGTRKLADAFVKLWETYGQFGQFVNIFTGELMAGGSGCGVIAAGALVRAYEYFGDEVYLKTAKESGEYYYRKALESGCTTGGPGEILQCPDSESAFALLESMTVLYEHTKEEKWLTYCKFAVEFCSSWVVAYNYRFPQTSEFAKLDMRTTGCVFANAQNKHAAPGICTFSGYSIYQVYKWTGDEKYLELFHDVVKSVSQFMSTEERPIHSWDVPKDASLIKGEIPTVEPEILPPGFICERVNMSDWESERCIGGVFPSSCCWCETSNLMVLAQCGDVM